MSDGQLERHPILAAIDRLRLAESLPPAAPALMGVCGNCQRNVYMGSAFLHGRGVYCATEGCVLAALGWNETPNAKAHRPA
jgi:hypothetical protein